MTPVFFLLWSLSSRTVSNSLMVYCYFTTMEHVSDMLQFYLCIYEYIKVLQNKVSLFPGLQTQGESTLVSWFLLRRWYNIHLVLWRITLFSLRRLWSTGAASGSGNRGGRQGQRSQHQRTSIYIFEWSIVSHNCGATHRTRACVTPVM